jgi:hypothetical protein
MLNTFAKPTKITLEPDQSTWQTLLGHFVIKFHFSDIEARNKFASHIQTYGAAGIISNTKGEIAVVASAYRGGAKYFAELGLKQEYNSFLTTYKAGTHVDAANVKILMSSAPTPSP